MTPQFWTEVATIATGASTFITLIYVIMVSRQLIDSRRQTQAQFIYELEKESYAHKKKFFPLYASIKEQKDVAFSPELEESLENYLVFFERIYTLVDIKVLDINLVERAFGYEFNLIVKSNKVRKMFEEEADRYQELIILKKKLGSKVKNQK